MDVNVLFVCTGNTCRSPMAEGVFNASAPTGMRATSAGMMAVGGAVSRLADDVCRAHGVDISGHTPVQLTGELVREADLTLTMTRDHADYLQWLYPAERDRIFPLIDYAENRREDVFDPYGGTADVYESCYGQIARAVAALIARLEGKA